MSVLMFFCQPALMVSIYFMLLLVILVANKMTMMMNVGKHDISRVVSNLQIWWE